MEGGPDGGATAPLEIGGGAMGSQRMHSQDPASLTGEGMRGGADSLAEMKKRRKE